MLNFSSLLLTAEGINLTQTDWIIIGALCSSIVILCVYIKQLTKIHRNEQKDNLVNMISAMTGNTKALEGNTKVIDEMQKLVYTVNERLIKLDAHGNRH